MIITPNQKILITLFSKDEKISAILDELSSDFMRITCKNYFDKQSELQFMSTYFRGKGLITEIEFTQSIFHYTLSIIEIQFKRGIIINQRI